MEGERTWGGCGQSSRCASYDGSAADVNGLYTFSFPLEASLAAAGAVPFRHAPGMWNVRSASSSTLACQAASETLSKTKTMLTCYNSLLCVISRRGRTCLQCCVGLCLRQARRSSWQAEALQRRSLLLCREQVMRQACQHAVVFPGLHAIREGRSVEKCALQSVPPASACSTGRSTYHVSL